MSTRTQLASLGGGRGVVTKKYLETYKTTKKSIPLYGRQKMFFFVFFFSGQSTKRGEGGKGLSTKEKITFFNVVFFFFFFYFLAVLKLNIFF